MSDYVTNVNKVTLTPALQEILLDAKELKIPIISDDAIHFIIQLIQISKTKQILEIGSAIGYSAIMMATYTDAFVTTIERDEDSYNRAIENVKKAGLESRIAVILSDALEYEPQEDYQCDLLFIDAAKAAYITFFERFSPYVREGGMIVTDNVLFHGLVEQPQTIQSKRIKQLVKKISAYNTFIKELDDYGSYLYKIGDGLTLSIKQR